MPQVLRSSDSLYPLYMLSVLLDALKDRRVRARWSSAAPATISSQELRTLYNEVVSGRFTPERAILCLIEGGVSGTVSSPVLVAKKPPGLPTAVGWPVVVQEVPSAQRPIGPRLPVSTPADDQPWKREGVATQAMSLVPVAPSPAAPVPSAAEPTQALSVIACKRETVETAPIARANRPFVLDMVLGGLLAALIAVLGLLVNAYLFK